MSFHGAGLSTRNFRILMAIAGFAGIALWLLGPALRSGSGSIGGTADAARPSSLALWMLDPPSSRGGTGSIMEHVNVAHPSPLRLNRAVQITSQGNLVTRVVVPVAVVGDRSITFPGDVGELSVETATSETSSAVVPATYALTWLDGNGDRILDPGEHAELTVYVPVGAQIHPHNPFNLKIKRQGDATLVIQAALGNMP